MHHGEHTVSVVSIESHLVSYKASMAGLIFSRVCAGFLLP